MRYHYTAKGTAAEEQPWAVYGSVKVEGPGNFPAAFDAAMRDMFQALTDGRAIFGKPGIGCDGPYRIHHFILEVE